MQTRYPIDSSRPLTAQVRALGLGRAGSRGPVALYRFFNGSALLYIGVTGYIPERWQAHKTTTDWWHLVTSVTVEEHPSKRHAEIAEVQAIRAEGPVFNKRSRITSRGLSVAGTNHGQRSADSVSLHGAITEGAMSAPGLISALSLGEWNGREWNG